MVLVAGDRHGVDGGGAAGERLEEAGGVLGRKHAEHDVERPFGERVATEGVGDGAAGGDIPFAAGIIDLAAGSGGGGDPVKLVGDVGRGEFVGLDAAGLPRGRVGLRFGVGVGGFRGRFGLPPDAAQGLNGRFPTVLGVNHFAGFIIPYPPVVK